MDKGFKQQLYKWSYEKIKSNPKRFGGDYSTAEIMLEYLLEFYKDRQVSSLDIRTMSLLNTITRMKNKLLIKHPHFDYRTKYKPAVKKDESSGSS